MTRQEQIDRLAAALQRPVVLYDRSMHLLGYSTHHDTEIDERRREAILSRRTQPRALELVRESGVHRSTLPAVIPSDGGHADRIGIAVRHDSVVFGYLVCTLHRDESTLAEAEQAALVAAAHEIAPLLAESQRSEDDLQERLDAALSDLLGADPSQHGPAAQTLSQAGFAQPGRPSVLVAMAGHDPEEEGEDPSTLLRQRPGLRAVATVSATEGLSPVAVIALPAPRDRLDLALPTYLRAGISDPFADLSDLPRAGHQARLALEAAWRSPYLPASPNPSPVAWSELGVDQLLLRLPLDDLGPADLPAAVQILMAHPAGEGLASTVECYLDQGGDAQATARALHIHRSTLYYRLDRVVALTGVDVRDGAQRHAIHLGLRVAALAGLRQGLTG